MSRVGVVSDIHGNLPAFEAVLEELQGDVEYIVCVGDIIGICGFPNEVIELVQSSCEVSIKGNHDIYPFEGELGSEVAELEKQLFFDETTEAQQSWLYKLPSMTDVPDSPLLLAHSYPFEGESAGFEDGNAGVFPREFVEVGAKFIDTILCLGHTHGQHSVDLESFGHSVLVVNSGSVGGYYQDEAQYSIVDTDTFSVEEYAVEYDKTTVTEKVKQMEEKYDIELLE